MLVIGSRGSQLALWQANYIKDRLAARGVECRVEVIHTKGDKITDVPLNKVGGKGLFTKEIEEALLDGRIDLAVHSMKDLPTELPKGSRSRPFPQRADPLRCHRRRQAARSEVRRDGRDQFAAPHRATAADPARSESCSPYAVISTPASTRWRKASTTPSCWRPPDCAGWAGATSSAKIFRADIMCPGGWARARWRSRRCEDGAGYEACAPLDDPWTRLPVTRNAPCWPNWAAVARCRSALRDAGEHGAVSHRRGVLARWQRHDSLHRDGRVHEAGGTRPQRGAGAAEARRARHSRQVYREAP